MAKKVIVLAEYSGFADILSKKSAELLSKRLESTSMPLSCKIISSHPMG